MNEVLYNDEKYLILDILSDEELYLLEILEIHFIRVQTFPLHMDSSCHCFSRGQKLSIQHLFPPVETLPNMTQGDHANDRDRGF